MPKYLKLIARYANSILVFLIFVLIGGLFSKGKEGSAIALFALAALLLFNLYLIEKAAMLLSEEEWLKAEIRKVLLRRRLANLDQEERAKAGGGHSEKRE